MRLESLLVALCWATAALAAPRGLNKRKATWVKPNRPLKNSKTIRAVQNEINYAKARRGVEKRLASASINPSASATTSGSVTASASVGATGPLIPSTAAAPTVAAPKQNIWASLSNDEAASVIAFIHNQTALNVTAYNESTSWDNYITVVDVAMPNKTDALAYFDGNASVPTRFATASIYFGATLEPYVQEFLVGPLPIDNSSFYASNDYVTTKGVNMIRNYDADGDAVYNFSLAAVQDIDDIVFDLTSVNVSDPDASFDIFGIDPLWHQDGRVIHWQEMWLTPSEIFDSETIFPLGLYFKLDVTGRDPSQWSVEGWLFNDIFYCTTADFRAAYEAGNVTALNQVVEGTWAGSNMTEPAFPLDTTTMPMAVETGPKRYYVDEESRYIQWMDFSFMQTFTRDTGVRLFDIRWQGKRIIYELGLQEAVAHYAGNDPVQSGTAYMDTYYGFGPYAFELVPGFDCPAYATYLNATFHADEQSRTHRNGICVFEADAGFAIQRHSSSKYTAVTANPTLILRSVSTVGNYDYTFDYVFYIDGTIEIVVRASGYIQAAYYAQNSEYGYHIHDALSGSMHDHALNFKADLDILGTKNSLQAHTIKPCNVSYVWNNYTRSTMKLERNFIETESAINWGANSQTFYMIANKDQPNKYGEIPGYRIMPSRGGAGMHLTIQDSPNLINSQGFATHSMYVTRQKDSEPRAASAWNDYDPACPIVDFSKFLDGESIDQEDLVLWFNLGMHHVPHTGDLPTTVMSTAQSAMMISPHNYVYGDPSRQTRQQIRIDHPSGDANITHVETFGVSFPAVDINVTALRPNYYAYEGDVAIMKWPYDPSNPFNSTDGIV